MHIYKINVIHKNMLSGRNLPKFYFQKNAKPRVTYACAYTKGAYTEGTHTEGTHTEGTHTEGTQKVHTRKVHTLKLLCHCTVCSYSFTIQG